MRSVGIIVIGALVVVACSSTTTTTTSGSGADAGSAPSDAGATSVSATPVDECQNLVTLLCTRLVVCTASDAGTTEQQQSSCEAAVGQSLNCPAATGVTSSYPACVNDIPNIDCAKVASNSPDALPQSCRAVVQAPTPPPSTSTAPVGPNGAKPDMIFGRQNSTSAFNVYLGCLCDQTDPDSVTSAVGLFGPQSKFNPNSIWNRFGTFGSDFSTQGVCDQFATDAPIVVNNGQMVGRLTRNQFASGAITDPNVVTFLSQSVCAN